MQVHQDIHHLPAFRKAVVTIGTFDGVHTGHRKIVDQLKAEAERIGGETVLITFHPHPRQVVQSGARTVPLILTIEEKKELLEAAGLDHLVIVPFTEAFSRLTAREYVEEFLIRYFHPHTLIIGYDHRFGAGREGNYQLLEKYREQGHFHLLEIAGHLIQESSVSSTRIREALLEGKTEEVAELLGYSFFFEGEVVEGNKLGRTLGFPTANLEPADTGKIIPGNGVYAVKVELRNTGEVFNGMMNIGLRPTVGGSRRMIEAHLFDFNRDIYGTVLRVTVLRRLRAEQKFDGLDALKDQLQRDAAASRQYLDGLNA